MSARLEEKTVIITGAASGMGRAGAVLFAKEGAKLALADIDEAGLAETAKLVDEAVPGAEISTTRVDLAVLDDIATFVADTVETFGGVDVIYNNAGINIFRSIDETAEADWDRLHAVNAKAQYFLVKYALGALRTSPGASVINVSSGNGLIAPSPGATAYSASKGAVVAVTRALAQELAADDIRVNCICPGIITTPMSLGAWEQIPAGERDQVRAAVAARAMSKREGLPEEVAAVAVFLATPDASYITGTIIPVDAGFSGS